MAREFQQQVTCSTHDSLISVVQRHDVAVISLVEEAVLVEVVEFLALSLMHQLVQVENKRSGMVVTVLSVDGVHDLHV